MKKVLVDLTETFALGKKIAEALPENGVVAFYGELGAGKTTIIKSIASTLAKIDPSEVTSPTFSYMHIYPNDVYHFDLYRIRDVKEFVFMGFGEYLRKGICLIEWAERIAEILPEDALKIHIRHVDQNTREISYES